jgi:DnaJ family protein C protein 28
VPNLSIEEIIRQAIDEGAFDDLPGKGKPLQLDQNPYQDPEWRAAHHILQNSGFTLPWIESLREIEVDQQEARAGLARTWKWYQAEVEKGIEIRRLNNEWDRAVDTFHEQIAAINIKIRSYNLQIPDDRFQLQQINVEQEIDRIKRSLD